ncbi:MAG: fibronectin type III domain-containing protein [bacterium]
MKNKIIFLMITLLLLLIVGSCERKISSNDPDRIVPEVGPIVTNLQAEVNDQLIRLTWDVINGTGVSKYRVYQSTDEGDIKDYILIDSSSIRSKDLSDLIINQVYYFKVAAVTNDGLEWDKSDAVSSQFTYLSISIANGDEFTKSRNIVVSIYAPVETSHIKLSENINFTDAVFIPFVGTGTQFELSDGDGTKWVYCELQFQNGSITGTPLQDNIILDTKAEISSITYSTPANGTYFQVGETITFTLDADEIDGKASVRFGSGSNLVTVNLLDDGVNPDVTADDGIYSGSWRVPEVFNAYGVEVTGIFSDAAGNSAANLIDVDLIYIYTPPAPVLLSALTESTHEIRLFWNLSTSDNFAAFRVFRSNSAGVSDQSQQINFFGSNVDNMTDDNLTDNTRYYYVIYTYDKSGLSSASNVVNATTLINTVPEAVELFAEVGSSETTVVLNWTKSNELYFNSYRIYRSKTTTNVTTSDALVGLITSQSSLSTSVPLDTIGAPSSNWFKIFVVDGHGLMTGSNTVQVNIP